MQGRSLPLHRETKCSKYWVTAILRLGVILCSRGGLRLTRTSSRAWTREGPGRFLLLSSGAFCRTYCDTAILRYVWSWCWRQQALMVTASPLSKVTSARPVAWSSEVISPMCVCSDLWCSAKITFTRSGTLVLLQVPQGNAHLLLELLDGKRTDHSADHVRYRELHEPEI
jgi:hypothetical protein